MNYTIAVPQNEAVQFEVNSLYEALLQLTDQRCARGKRYPLAAILTLSVLAKLGGQDTPEGMAEWVKHRAKLLRTAVGITHPRLPHAVTYRRVWRQALDVRQLEGVVGQFFARSGRPMKALALDGKSLRGTIPTGHSRGVYLLALYAPQTGLVLNQMEIGQKENELTAAPAVLGGVDLVGRLVTGDALFTQRDLSKQIVAAKGHYLWKVKDNQPTLHADILRLFGPETVPRGSGPLQTDFRTATQVRKGHGRLETQRLTASSLLAPTSDWPHLAQVFQLVREVRHLASGKTSHEVLYGVTDLAAIAASPHSLLALTRQHWGIENGLHYRRDVTFHEDASRLRDQAAHVIAILNNLTLGLCRQRGFGSIPQARRRLDAFPDEALGFVLHALA